MRARVAATFLLFVLLGVPFRLAAAGLPDPASILTLDSIRPGMTGFGLSVFRGTQIDTFRVEILGVLETSTPSAPMILARLSDQDLDRSGIIAGMSGSPVYLEGRLIGAVAFGWPYSADPIAGITPIEGMMSLTERNAGQLEGAAPRTGWSPDRWRALWGASGDAVWEVLQEPAARISGAPAPLAVPIALSGVSESAGQVMAGIFSTRGFLPVQAGATSAPAPGSDNPTLRPGSAVGLELVRGDASIAAIGTVTWTDGRSVLAFGHRMFNLGAAAYPMNAATILTVLPRLSSSMKLGAVGAPIGAFTRDYNTGVTGEIGASPRLIPMELALDLGGRREVFHFEVLEADALTPALAGMLTLNVLEGRGRSSGPVTLRITTRVRLRDHREVTAHSVAAGFAPPMAAGGEVARVTGLLAGNPFLPVGFESITVEIAMLDAIEASFLEGVTLDPGSHRAGETIHLAVDLRDYRGESHRHRTTFPLPADLTPGEYRLVVCDADQAGRLEQERAPAIRTPVRFEQILDLLETEPAEDQLVLRLLALTPSPIVAGREFARLPGSLRPIFTSGGGSVRPRESQATLVAEQIEDLGRFLIGCEAVTVTVEEGP